MKKLKRMPVTIPLDYSGTYSNTINDFLNAMESVVGENVHLDIDIRGYATVYFENELKSMPMDAEPNISDL